MPVRAVLIDLDGTLITEEGNAVARVSEMLEELRSLGIAVCVASNRPRARERLEAAGLEADLVLDRATVGAAKGSPRWVQRLCAELGVEPIDVVALGDTDNDMRTALNGGGLVYFHAGWSEPEYPYGIIVRDPLRFSLAIRECFSQEPRWWWSLDEADAAGRGVRVRALMDGSGAGSPAFKSDLIGFLKDGRDPRVGPLRARSLAMLHLLGTLYLDGLCRVPDTWCVYPGHAGGSNKALGPWIGMGARLFRDRYAEGLLVRHTEAPDSGRSRHLGTNSPRFPAQINTVHLDPAQRARVEGRRVLLIDDFITAGHSAECGRNLLLAGGATEVVVIAIGKYGPTYLAQTPKATFDPYAPCEHEDDDWSPQVMRGRMDNAALAHLRASYARVEALGRHHS